MGKMESKGIKMGEMGEEYENEKRNCCSKSKNKRKVLAEGERNEDDQEGEGPNRPAQDEEPRPSDTEGKEGAGKTKH